MQSRRETETRPSASPSEAGTKSNQDTGGSHRDRTSQHPGYPQGRGAKDGTARRVAAHPIGANQAALTSSIAYCRQVVRTRARNFYFGMKLTPEPERSALYALYAWTRHADDLVDGAGNNEETARRAVEHMRQRTANVVCGDEEPGTETFWPAFAHWARRYSFDMADLEAMLDGQLDDLATRRRSTFDDLYRYCDRVAGTVGRLCLSIWGTCDAQQAHHARQLAEWRGIAFQLTNILRDVHEDYERGRVYLPLEDFDHFEITERQLVEWSAPRPCLEFIRFQVDRARSYYERSRDFDRVVSSRGAAAGWAMAAVYQSVLAQIAAQPERVIAADAKAASDVRAGRSRAHVSRARKVMIMAVAPWVAGRLRRAVG